MTAVEEVQSFNEFVVNEVFSALYYVSGLFTVVTSFCEADEEEGHVIRKECSPSKLLLMKQKSSEKKDELDMPKGLFALSFEKIPCNEPIKPCQFRTGRRYIQPDNFPDDDGLDHYLGYMAQLSSKMEKLKTTDSSLSFDFATEDHLQFQMLSEQVVELFPKLDCNMIQALKSYYPHQVEFLMSQDLTSDLVQDYFTCPNGEEDIGNLEDMCFYLRALAEDAQDLATRNPQVTPKDYQDFLEENCCDKEPPLPTPEVSTLYKFDDMDISDSDLNISSKGLHSKNTFCESADGL